MSRNKHACVLYGIVVYCSELYCIYCADSDVVDWSNRMNESRKKDTVCFALGSGWDSCGLVPIRFDSTKFVIQFSSFRHLAARLTMNVATVVYCEVFPINIYYYPIHLSATNKKL